MIFLIKNIKIERNLENFSSVLRAKVQQVIRLYLCPPDSFYALFYNQSKDLTWSSQLTLQGQH